MLSIGQRTPKISRRSGSTSRQDKAEKTITIKCQRLNADKQYEEVEVEVPAPIYETLRFYNSGNDSDENSLKKSNGNLDLIQKNNPATPAVGVANHNKNRSIAARIKSLFGGGGSGSKF